MLSLNIGSPSNISDVGIIPTSMQATNNIPDYSDPGVNVSIPNTIPALLAPSGTRDMQANTVFGSQFQMRDSDSTNLQNNIAITQRTLENQIQGDMSQEQTLSLNQLHNLLQFPDVLKVLGLNPDGQVPQSSLTYSQTSLSNQSVENGTGYDPHNIQLDDLVAIDEMAENDIEIDGSKISSSTENECESDKEETDCTDKCDKCKIAKSKCTKDHLSLSKEKISSKKETEDKSERDVVQSDVITSNVDSDVEEG